jgi:hypothetical protein
MGTPFAITIPINANTLTRARFIEERLLPLVPIFHSYEKTFAGLLELNDRLVRSEAKDSHTTMRCTLRNMSSQVASYNDNVHHLLRKIDGIAQLFSDMLALKNQHIAQEQNNQLTKMTQVTVQDSATIRVIGVATLVFLPTTFVAVSHQPMPLEQRSLTKP